MGSKALILIAMVSLACAANAAEQMSTMEQLQNEGMLPFLTCLQTTTCKA